MRQVLLIAAACGATPAAAALASSGDQPRPAPAGLSAPTGAGSQQFRFGDCRNRNFAAGEGWVCVQEVPDAP